MSRQAPGKDPSARLCHHLSVEERGCSFWQKGCWNKVAYLTTTDRPGEA